jgi:hypothetical protein
VDEILRATGPPTDLPGVGDIGEGVEEQAVSAGDVIEPLVSGIAGGSPAFLTLG